MSAVKNTIDIQRTWEIAFEQDDSGTWRTARPRCFICDCETATGRVGRALCEPCRLQTQKGGSLFLSGLTHSPHIYVETVREWVGC